MYEAACAYVEAGLRVFPVTRGGKTPDKRLAPHGFHDATDDLDLIARWFDVPNPPNIGIPTEGLLVVDVDILKDPPRPNPWPDDPAKALDLGNCPTVETPSGGRHHLTRDPKAEWRNSTSVLGPGVDVRATGGYIVAPPSIIYRRPADRWLTDAKEATYRWLSDPPTCLDDIPEWFPWLERDNEDNDSSGMTRVRRGPARGRMTDEEWYRLVAGVAEGGRHDAMLRIVGRMLGHECDLEDVMGTAFVANANNKPPLPATEVRKIVADLIGNDRRDHPERYAKKALAVVSEELGADVTKKAEKKIEEKAEAREEKKLETEADRLEGLDVKDATERVATEFSWTGGTVVAVEQTNRKAGHELFSLRFENGDVVALGSAEVLFQYQKIRAILAAEFRKAMPPSMHGSKGKRWRLVVTLLLKATVVLDPEFTPETEALEWVRDYCSDVRAEQETAPMHKSRQPYIDGTELRVQASAMVEWLYMSRRQRLTSRELCERLARIGFVRRTVTLEDPDRAGARCTRSYCCGPVRVVLDEPRRHAKEATCQTT